MGKTSKNTTAIKANPRASDKLTAFGVDAILDKVVSGIYYSKIAKEVGVGESTLLDWLGKNHSELYARAREARWHKLAQDVIEIADDSSRDVYVDENGKERTDQEVVARSRLKVDARKWLVSKMLPKVYADRVDVNQTVTMSDLTDEELDRRLKEKLATNKKA